MTLTSVFLLPLIASTAMAATGGGNTYSSHPNVYGEHTYGVAPYGTTPYGSPAYGGSAHGDDDDDDDEEENGTSEATKHANANYGESAAPNSPPGGPGGDGQPIAPSSTLVTSTSKASSPLPHQSIGGGNNNGTISGQNPPSPTTQGPAQTITPTGTMVPPKNKTTSAGIKLSASPASPALLGCGLAGTVLLSVFTY
ncbi:MAG: hypothetical protein DHS80DRAFT_21007 [Piptocephalis tieghemiana]|nr:MAG: hypothetical protein DHS80DRAFT_21007 [Piptocephalis tieghemiana]